MDPAQLSMCLAQLLQPDTELVKAAEAALKPFLKNPLCLGGLLQQIQSHPDAGVRQIAAVVLRKRVPGHWGKLDAASQATVQAALLAVLQSEGERIVRRAVCTVACAVAGKCFENPATPWQQLLDFVAACCGAPQEEAREMGHVILEHLGETVGLYLPQAVPSIAPMLLAGLSDASATVQSQALRATGALMTATADGDAVLPLADLIPPMLQVLHARCASGDEEVVAEVLEVLDELAQTPVGVLNKHVPALVAFLLEMVKAETLEPSTRDQAGMVIGTLAECKPKLLGKRKLVPPILEAMLHLIAASDESAAGSLHLALADNMHDPAEGGAAAAGGEEEEDDEDDEGMTPGQIAQACIDKLGTSLPMKYIWEPGLAAALQCLGTGESRWRKAGACCLGNLAEGCQDPLREVLDQCLPPLLAAAGDPDKFAREAACFCLGQMAEHCQPEIMRYQDRVLPVVFGLMDDPLQSVQAVACYVLETFSEHLTAETVGPLLPQLTGKLLQLGQSPRLSIREMSLSALSSTAAAAEALFQPFAADVVATLAAPLQATEERFFTLRGRALECLGHVAIAVGKEAFAPFLALGMASAEQALQLPDAAELHEFVYSFFGTVARVIEADFAAFLPSLVPHLCEVVARSDGTEVQLPEEEGGYDLARLRDDEDDDEDGGAGGTYLQIRTADMDAKRTAVVALGMVAESVGPAFTAGGYLAPAMTALLAQREYFHSSVREEVLTALSRVVRAAAAGAFGSVDAVPPYTPGDLARTLEGLEPSGAVAAASGASVRALTACLLEDESKKVVAVACAGLQSILELLGPAALAPVMAPGWLASGAPGEGEEPQAKTAANALLDLLHEKAPCQVGAGAADEAGAGAGGAGDELDGDEEGDHDNVVMDSVADLAGAFAKVLGPAFSAMSTEVVDAVGKFAKANRPASDRAMAIGVFAEVLQYMGPAGAAHVPAVAPVVQAGLGDASSAVRRNAAFATGILAEVAPAAMAPHYPVFLAGLRPLFEVSHRDEGAMADNACSAAARLMVANLAAVPTDQVLPVFLGAIPLKVDMTENDCVYGCLAGLLEMRHPHLVALLPQALTAVAHGLGSPAADAVKARLVAGLKALAGDATSAAALAAAQPQIPAEAGAVLQAALSS